MTQTAPKPRRISLDVIRGITLISMIGYHAMWDLVYMYGIPAPWYRSTPGYLWQQSICWTFILLSGYCWGLGRRPLRRGITVSIGGLIVTIVTLIFMPAQRVVFGVLTFIGAAMLLMIPIGRLTRRLPGWIGLVMSLLLFFLLRNVNSGSLGFESLILGTLPDKLYANLLTTFIGFPSPGFFSTDYFALLPWFFLFTAGHFLRLTLPERKTPAQPPKILLAAAKPFAWIGRHSLILYLIHQPVIYLLCELIF